MMGFSWLLLCSLVATVCSKKQESDRPNILFILIDDLGWSDISAQGGQFPTPNIDALFDDSIKLHRHYIHMMCSPSRTQYLTGRYAMYQGINKMTPWDYTEIGGIPIGQPTLAQWLKETGGYRTYGVGKWHMGYAFDGLMPLQRGFDHWYGFLQGAVNYATKLYDDVKYGPTPYYDFWYNDEIDYTAEGTNSMYQYNDRIRELLVDHKESHSDEPFFIYAPLQAIHGPLRQVDAYHDDCNIILGHKASSSRFRYCENTLLMDQVVGEMVYHVKELGFWDNSVIVFGTDNGANLDNEGCNYPLRGTKGTLFEGNIRTIAFATGGLVPVSDKEDENVRHSLFSNLDWTPTLLDFAGLLDDIDTKDYTWDGVSQKKVILHGDKFKSRDHLVLNIGLPELASSSIIFEHQEGSNKYLYKYVHSSDETIDRWSWYRVNGWCEYDEDGNVRIVEEGADEENVYEYLYELYTDEREKNNLVAEKTGGKTDSSALVDTARKLMKPYSEHHLWSERIACLWHRVPNGDPSLIDDGKSVRPFLSKKAYMSRISKCFDEDERDGRVHSQKKKRLYTKEWTPPGKSSNKRSRRKRSKTSSHLVMFAGVLLVLLVLYGLRVWCKSCHGKGWSSTEETTPLLPAARTKARG